MAYSKSPTQDTYSTEEIKLLREISSRAGNLSNYDEDYVNVLIESSKSKTPKPIIQDNRTFITKRAGSASAFSSVTSGVIRGSLYWTDKKLLYYAIGTSCYIYSFSTNTTITVAGAYTVSTGPVGFAEFLYNNGTSVIVTTDGTTLSTITSTGTRTVCTDVDLPTPHDTNLIFFDGYIFLAKLGTGEIWNSAQNDPLSWDPTFFIDAEIEADTVLKLAKINNYLIVFGADTIEYFFDAGNATGSPLQRNDTPIKRISYLTGLAQEMNNLFFIGSDYNGNVDVYKMQDFKAEPISTPTIGRYLNTLGGDFTQWVGSVISYLGHNFYVINAGSKTYVYDIDNQLWTRIAYQSNINFNILRAHTVKTSTATTSLFTLGDSTGNWYKFDETLYQDSGVNFSCIIVTENTDFGNLYRKSMHRLSLYADRPPIGVSGPILVQWSDDDYQTYNSGITCELNQDLASIYQLGNFRQRCFKLTFAANTLFRIQGMVADINKGHA